jgi:hypothetical protein
MNIKTFGLLLVALLIFTSCSNTAQDSSETLPGINIPADRFNTAIKLVDAPESLNSHKNGETLSLRIMNLSNATIVFPENYGIKLFTKKDEKWIEFPNNFYNAGGSFQLPTQASAPLGLIAGTMPYQADLASSITIRVVIIGQKANETEQVGAYIDVIINP